MFGGIKKPRIKFREEVLGLTDNIFTKSCSAFCIIILTKKKT